MDEFRLLGPLEAVVDGRPLSVAAEKPRALLAVLLLEANRVVPTERLVDELWGDDPPARATKTLQVYVSQLRKALGSERLVTRPPGYELRVAPGELDVERFQTLTAESRELLAAGEAGEAAAALREALALWRGPALREFRAEPFADAAAARLEELRFTAREDLLQAELEGGAAAAVVPELEELVVREPLRERPRELLMLALYRAGRQADALELYRRTRELFVEELGIEPGSRLRELEASMLRQDDALTLSPRPVGPAATAAAQAPARRGRILLAVLGAALLAGAGIAAAALLNDGGTTAPPTSEAPELRTFVVNLENFLGQSRTGRVEVRAAVQGAAACSLSRRDALVRLDRVQANRQSLLQQIAALRVPAGGAPLRAADLLQQAGQASIRADALYRDWIRTRPPCPRSGPPPSAAQQADVRATALKRRFVAVFNPLARREHLRTWRADEF